MGLLQHAPRRGLVAPRRELVAPKREVVACREVVAQLHPGL